MHTNIVVYNILPTVRHFWFKTWLGTELTPYVGFQMGKYIYINILANTRGMRLNLPVHHVCYIHKIIFFNQ